MHPKGFWILLLKRIAKKWFTFTIASLGIAVGIWAITLITGISVGASNTIKTAINSQDIIKVLSVTKLEGGGSFLSGESPEFVPFSINEFKESINEVDNVVSSTPDGAGINVQIYDKECEDKIDQLSFSDVYQELLSLRDPAQIEALLAQSNLSQDDFAQIGASCAFAPISITTIQNAAESLQTIYGDDWVGSRAEPERNEIVTCFKCGEKNLADQLGAKTPEELIGKKVNIRLTSAAQMYKLGTNVVFSFVSAAADDSQSETSLSDAGFIEEEFEIVSVIDDTDASFLSFPVFLINDSYYTEAFEKANPEANFDNYGFINYEVVVNDFVNVDQVKGELLDAGYSVNSLGDLVTPIQAVFTGLNVVFGLFGVIALFASFFGILNVMFVSVLERRKEIGILKSLGAKNRSIFNLFMTEGFILGTLGWVIGVLNALLWSTLISWAVDSLLQSNKGVRDSLDIFGITGFDAVYPWWILLVTFLLAITVTTISGVIPAVQASRQNPVDVLRSE